MIQENFRKTELEKTHQDHLKMMNNILTETIQLTSTDFVKICNKLADLDKEHGSKENIFQELQYVDALQQKLQHILQFQEAILTGKKITHDDGEEIDIRNIAGSVLKLNYYQAVAAQEDFSKTVKKVQAFIRDVGSYHDAAASFTNLETINDNFRELTSSLDFLAGEYVAHSDFDLSHVTDYFSDQYSMLSERIVLNWCVSSEYESVEDFKRYYAGQEKGGSVELF
jgi:hypothetical protein